MWLNVTIIVIQSLKYILKGIDTEDSEIFVHCYYSLKYILKGIDTNVIDCVLPVLTPGLKYILKGIDTSGNTVYGRLLY